MVPGGAAGAAWPHQPSQELFRLIVPVPLPSYNQVLGKSGWTRARLIKTWKQSVQVCAAAASIHGLQLEGPMGLQVTRYGAQALDVDNLVVKALVDGLRAARVILDDKPSIVRWLHVESYRAGRTIHRTEIIAWAATPG